MYVRAILFVLAASWFYLAVFLARMDRRWYARRIVVSAFMGTLTAIFLWREWWSANAITFLGLSFLIFGLYPAYIERRALDAVAERKGKIPAALKAFMWGMSWDRGFRAARAVEEAIRDSGEAGVNLDGLISTLSGSAGPQVRSRFMAPLILHLVNSRRWNHACSAFEAVFSRREEATASILLLMVRPYAERGALEEAYSCLAAARVQGLPAELRVEWFLAATALLAFGGKGEALDGFFARHPEVLGILPSPFQPYWRGIADAASGDPESARKRFEQAAFLAGADPLWSEAIGFRLAQAERPHLTDAGLTDAQVSDILSLRGETEESIRGYAVALGRGATPWTLGLIIANILIWVAMLAPTIGAGGDELVKTLIIYGANVSSLVKYGGEYWRLISSMFIHVGVLHLLVNSYACYLFGTFVERFTGGRQMFVLYMASGIAGSMASALLGGYEASAGASGAIMGLLGAAIALQVRYRHLMPRAIRNVYLVNFSFMAALTLVFGVIEPQVDNFAHTGGLIMGLLLGFAALRSGLEKDEDRRGGLRLWTFNALTALFALTLAYSAWQAAANIISGGYPVRPTRMMERRAGEHGLAFETPVFWRMFDEDDSVSLIDPVGRAALTLTFHPSDVPARESDLAELADRMWMEHVTAPNRPMGALEKPVRIELGGRTMFRVSFNQPFYLEGRKREIRHDIYITELSGRPLIARFECHRWDHADFLPLMRRILASIRLDDSKTGNQPIAP